MNHQPQNRSRLQRLFTSAFTLCAAGLLLAGGQQAQAATQALQAYLKAGTTAAGDNLGYSVAISGDTAVVGMPFEGSGAGAAYIYVRSAGVWTQQGGKLTASNREANDKFGYAVAIAGDTLVIGAPGEASNASGANGNQADNSASGAGAVYVFTRTGATWTQQAYLKASNPGAGDNFGGAVAVSGDTVVVGAPWEDGSSPGVNGASNELATDSGAAYVFTRSGTIWSQQAYLKASNPGGGVEDFTAVPPIIVYGDNFGASVAISGDTVVVGAAGESSSTTGVNSTPNRLASSAGAAYVFTRSATTWNQQAYLKASNAEGGDGFGNAVAIAGDTVVVGASNEASASTTQTDNTALGAGAAYVFTRSANSWSQQAYLKASNPGANDNFGSSVAIATDTVVVGAKGEDSSSTGVNSTPNELATDSGAAYVFIRSGTAWTQQSYLKASNPGGGNGSSIYGDAFGSSVAISGDTVIVGSPYEASNATGVNAALTGGTGTQADNSANQAGAAYVYTSFGPVVPAPTVTSIAPTSGSTAGGTSVTITGTGFTGATGVTIGGAAATSVSVVSATSITCTTPAGTAGTASVIVTTPGGANAANMLYTYVVPNTAPTLAAIGVSGTEDTTLTFTALNFTSAYSDPESVALASIKVASLPATGTLKLSGTDVTVNQVIPLANLGNLTYVPVLNENGAKTFTVTASDGSLSSSPATTVTMTLTAVNDAPSFALPDPRGVVAWGDNTSGQTVIPANLSGVTAIAAGYRHIVALKSDGTVVAWGFNQFGQTSIPANLSGVTVTAIAAGDANTVTVATINQTVAADGVARTVPNFATGFSPGPANESAQTLLGYTVTVEAGKTGLFSTAPAVANNGTLTYTPAVGGLGGSALITVVAQDSGGTANGGVDKSTNTFTITVTHVNEAPVRTAGTVANLTVLEDARATSLGLSGLAYSHGPAGETAQTLTYTVMAVPASTLGNVVLTDGTTVVAANTVYTLAQLQGMKFKPAANANGGPATFSWKVQDDGGTANGGVDTLTQSLTLTVTAVNDAPSFALRPRTTLTGLSNPKALAFDSAGNLYVANLVGNTVSKFAPGATTASATLTGLDGPSALAVDGEGNLYVANSGNFTVSIFARGATSPTATLTGLNRPKGLAFDGAGNLYVANYGDSTVSEFAPGATIAKATHRFGNANDGLETISGFAVDEAGNIFVSQNFAYGYYVRKLPADRGEEIFLYFDSGRPGVMTLLSRNDAVGGEFSCS